MPIMEVTTSALKDESQKPVTEAWLARCREIAAQCWCQPTTSSIVFDGDLAEVFANVLAHETSRPWLGNATTGELKAELNARGADSPDDYYTACGS